ncbi:hypothetical protein [Nonomuraea soli]|uniref:Uncharacterized protein n=1 Tax=Nonomuraea soli TaxID=1032476 RepID=A0A7W0HQB3_9ACTN|nr:hypothetical protein [Nonomuraea soli]MBA2891728.1 hypothetical protein [Nonomuraea soli]
MHTFAAAIAPVIDAVHVDVHVESRKTFVPPAFTPGLLIDQRYTLPLRPLTRADLAVVYRYGVPDVTVHLQEGTLIEHPGGRLEASKEALDFIDTLYSHHSAATRRLWPDVKHLADLVGRVLDQALRDPGPALAVMAPPYEPIDEAGVLLFNRLAALRYHRADSHAAAWQAEGLSASAMAALEPGEQRERIERVTNERAAVPYETLSDSERAALLDGLLALVRQPAR